MRSLLVSIILPFLTILLAASPVAYASSISGTIDATNRYANGLDPTVGRIDFGASAAPVHVTDSGLSGDAWGETTGWINLAPSQSGVGNDGNGTLSGYAWGENAGWINFAPPHGGVTIDTNGIFHGYAWSQNLGWISFNCANDSSCGASSFYVQTDWRPASVRRGGGANGGSGGGGEGNGPPSVYGPTNGPQSASSAQPGTSAAASSQRGITVPPLPLTHPVEPPSSIPAVVRRQSGKPLLKTTVPPAALSVATTTHQRSVPEGVQSTLLPTNYQIPSQHSLQEPVPTTSLSVVLSPASSSWLSRLFTWMVVHIRSLLSIF